ncbi:helix-hairpin-helix domain-containing protein [Mycolicibacterium sp. XJ1819]
MRTELPAERLHRRLGREDEDGADGAEADDAAPSDAVLSRWLPETKTDRAADWLTTVRADPRRSGAIALAVVGAVAVLVTLFTLARDRPPAVVSANLPPVQMVSSTAPTPEEKPGADQPVVVSVVGLVHKPGLVTLDGGGRIADALTAAGGALDGADLLGLNMARRVVDGEQIVVGIASAPGEPSVMGSSVTSDQQVAASPGASATATATDGSVNLNTATVEQLDTLPGIGPVTAAAIVAWRDTNGKFSSVEQLGDVDGIGPARLEKLREHVHV